MDKIIKSKNKKLKQVLSVPGDKSISHRAVMFSSLAYGETEIEGFLNGDDCLSTISCFKKLGVTITFQNDKVKVIGKGLRRLSAPSEILDVGNSGTTLRLLTGILSAQNFTTNITGDASIQKRPMDRVIKPLSQMGADIIGKDGGTLAPLTIHGKNLKAMDYTMTVSSAQVKSAIMLASLYADGETVIEEPVATRNHTEIMLNYLGANVKTVGKKIICTPPEELFAKKIIVPGDISSAAFFIVAALICKDSHLIITNVGVNITRTGIITALKEMGADLSVINRRELCGEFVADIEVKYSHLKGTVIEGAIIPRLIDEIPILAVAAMFAEGTTVIKNAEELKVKESNRIKTVVNEFQKLGADIVETDDGMIITGGKMLYGAEVESHHDHRIAMALAICALATNGETLIKNADCVDISFPKFYEYIESL